MGDSQNWSAFDEPEAPKKPVALKPKQPEAEKSDEGFKLQAMDLRNFRNRLIFGGLVGFCTGATFGTIDAVKVYQKQHNKVSLAAINQVARGAAVSGGAFAGFFLAYQGVKTVMEVQRGTEDLVNVGVATVTAGIPFLGSKILRHNIPYALMLVALDHFHEEINAHR
ncbi:hypothetical protein Poli38472_010977 [Pythium oligandrum]|uniref:Mitochondrial import inner membrane translocase subunit TIM22 n=1 Tax=Pythium oligandrum TaxID=41045 RepID=A0A8K1CEE3_PYTOL|nr:hypothetical protein Poli38472_010977 [Pythium oligandrum]|eukprot:TMW61914.1 hypothetical protein Poli38472_010977 [Pythium oligandrum]